MFWCSLVGADRPPKEAMPVAIACLEQEDLGSDVLCWERKVIRAEKIADRWQGPTSRQVRVHFEKSGYSSGEK